MDDEEPAGYPLVDVAGDDRASRLSGIVDEVALSDPPSDEDLETPDLRPRLGGRMLPLTTLPESVLVTGRSFRSVLRELYLGKTLHHRTRGPVTVRRSGRKS